MAVMVVNQFAVRSQRAVLNHKRDVVLVARQPAVYLGAVFQQIESREAHIEVSTGAEMVVIVVPECRGPPGVRIFVAPRLPWGDRVRGKSVEFWPSNPAVQVNDAGRAEIVGVGH